MKPGFPVPAFMLCVGGCLSGFSVWCCVFAQAVNKCNCFVFKPSVSLRVAATVGTLSHLVAIVLHCLLMIYCVSSLPCGSQAKMHQGLEPHSCSVQTHRCVGTHPGTSAPLPQLWIKLVVRLLSQRPRKSTLTGKSSVSMSKRCLHHS